MPRFKKLKPPSAAVGKVEAKRNLRLAGLTEEYKNIFGMGTNLRTRIDTIMNGGVDPLPGTCNSILIEQMLYALQRRMKNPVPLGKLKGNGQAEEEENDNKPTLLPRVHESLAALFTVAIERK